MVRIRTVKEFLWQITEQYGESDAYQWEQNGNIIAKSYFNLNDDVSMMAREIHRTFGEQRNIVIISETSYYFMCAFYGAIVSGNIAIPMDTKAQKDDMIKRINFSDASIVMISDKFANIKEDIKNSCSKVNRIIDIDHFLEEIPESAAKEALPIIYPDQVSVMLFTSGTTGNGFKAAMLTQDGILAGVKGYIPLFRPGDKTLSVLPIHHCFELFEGQMKASYSGCTICINDDITNLIQNLKKFKITNIIAVPAIANLLCSIIERGIKDKPIDEVKELNVLGHRFEMNYEFCCAR